MIAYFPISYPDELWYSVCARFSDRMQFGNETGTMQALYGSRHAIATVDLPHRLGALAAQLPLGHPCTVETIIDHHTFLPYYSPFLTVSTCRQVRAWMSDSTKSCARIKCGACTNRIPLPEFFRSCPECDRENRKQFGETYWHRLFQLPGVEVCPVHRVFLENSDIRLNSLPNRHKYFSAEKARLGTELHRINQKNPAHQVMLELARQTDWLLQQQCLNPGLEFLHTRYREVLGQRGFATRAGSIRMNELRQAVREFYGPELLGLLQCSLPDGQRFGWLGHLLRKQQTAVAPLRHLVLLRALGAEMKSFFHPQPSPKPVTSSQPSRPASWPCFNHVCDRGSSSSIPDAALTDPDTNGNRHWIIHCRACGFTYQVPYGTARPTQPSRILDYGSKWKGLLRRQWSKADLTLRQMAKNLGVDPKTVKQHAVNLGLPFPRKGKRPVTRRGLYTSRGQTRAEKTQHDRQAWGQLRRENPDAGTKRLRILAPALYARLYRSDRDWLSKHRPKRKPPHMMRPYLNWAQRDEELAGRIATAAAHIRLGKGRPKQVTITAIGRLLGTQALFEASLSKLP